MRSVGVLTADAVTGPYTFAAPCFRPDGRDSYDMGTFVDATGDGRGYLIRSVENQFAGISQMTLDCLNVTGIISAGPDMEGQAIMRDTQGILHAAGSHLTGWAANAAQFVTTNSSVLNGSVWTGGYGCHMAIQGFYLLLPRIIALSHRQTTTILAEILQRTTRSRPSFSRMFTRTGIRRSSGWLTVGERA